MSEDEQREACRKAKLFSRVEPAHKSKIVEYLQKEGAVSAMVSEYMYNCPCLPDIRYLQDTVGRVLIA